MREIWVDFNDRENGMVPAKADGDVFGHHELVMAYDDDGNHCPAFVADIDRETGWLALAVKWEAFEPAPPQIVGQSSFIEA